MLDPLLAAVIDEIDAYRKTRDDAWQIPREEGELLHQIALSTAAKVVVEVGTSYGFSGLFWAAALRRTGGRLHTIDVSQKKFDASRATFAKAGVSDLIASHLGDAREVLAHLEAPVDIAFLDADKESTRAYFDIVWPKVRPGGSVIVDNSVTHRADLVEYVKHVRSLPGATSTEVAVGNGIEWTIKAG